MAKKESLQSNLNLRKLNRILSTVLIIVIIAIFIAGGLINGIIQGRINKAIQDNIKRQEQTVTALYEKAFSPKIREYVFKPSHTYFCSCFTCISSSSGIHGYLGEFTITAYTAGAESTGKKPGDRAYGITKSGEPVTEEITIASDWNVIPPGTWVYIEDVGYRQAQDIGSDIKGNRIDLYIPELVQADEWGVQQKHVWIVENVD